MSCSNTQADLPAFLDGSMAPEEAADLARHLMACGRCRAALLSARVPRHGLPVSGPEDPGFWGPMDAAILAELGREPAPPQAPGGPLWWLSARTPIRRSTLLAIGAALVLALAWGYSREPQQEPAAALPALSPSALPPRATERPQLQPATHVPAHGSL